ncbi:MAG: ribose-5-phosphate isomerase RpiA [Candidatus Thermoplasmatota archaeon]|nr:ribose-5-phosphate isomerase RpiA [Candidatus Thermoplasmatota archaeon]
MADLNRISLAKRAAGERSALFVEDGTVVGLGSGSTIVPMVYALAERMKKEGLEVVGIPTSNDTAALAKELGIPLSTLDEHPIVDLTIDGADEVDPNLCLIKGLGGALVREKIVAAASKSEVIVVDEGKMVQRLGERAPLPVEIVQFCWQATKRKVEALGCTPVLRTKEKPFVSDNGNYILDCRFSGISDPHHLETELNLIPGVVENGLFLDIASAIVVGDDKGGTRIIKKD